MGTIAYRHTITDPSWFDAVPIMANFNQVKNELNGQLDENNFSASMDPTVDTIEASEEISGALIEPTGDLEVTPSEGKGLDVRLESAPTTHYLRLDSDGVRIG